jgi:hypothetical protein
LYIKFKILLPKQNQKLFLKSKGPAASQVAQRPKRPASSVAARQQARFAPAVIFFQKGPRTIE